MSHTHQDSRLSVASRRDVSTPLEALALKLLSLILLTSIPVFLVSALLAALLPAGVAKISLGIALGVAIAHMLALKIHPAILRRLDRRAAKVGLSSGA